MRTISKIKSYILLIPMFVTVLFNQSCTEVIEDGLTRNTADNTIVSYLEEHADVYSEYLKLLDNVKVPGTANSSVKELLSERGNYTCFAPTNEAIHDYLSLLMYRGIISDSTWSASEFQEVNPETGRNDLLYEIQRNIVYGSIIDAGDNSAAYQTSDFKINEMLAQTNMNGRKLRVSEGRVTKLAVEGSDIDNEDCNIYTINGYIHQVHKVIESSDETVADIFRKVIEENKHGFYTYAVLLEACGLYSELSQTEDGVYCQMLVSGELEQHFSAPHPTYSGTGDPEKGKGANGGSNSYGWYPKRRMIGFTMFLEKDSWWEQALGLEDNTIHSKSAEEVVALVADYVKENRLHMPNATNDENYTNDNNALNQFVTYHILPAKIEYDKLVIHFNEYGYSQDLKQHKSCVYDYYTTMGKRRLLKTYEAPITAQGKRNAIYLNRFPVINNATDGDYTEISCESDKAGVEVMAEGVLAPCNAYVYPIDECLYFNEQTSDFMGRERLRIDVASMFKEFLTNDIRSNETPSWPHQCVGIPITSKYSYCEDLEIGDETRVHYLTGRYGGNGSWANYQGDEFNVVGNYEITMKLPPVPKDGEYELRMGLSANNRRGICQVHWGTNKNALPAAGMPVDMRMTGTMTVTMSNQVFGSTVGWEPDVNGDDDLNAEIDKRMRSKGYMKGPKGINYIGGYQLLRDRQQALRRIVIRSDMKANETYYIQFRNVMDNLDTELYIDYIELCPKTVFDNPVVPEDIW